MNKLKKLKTLLEVIKDNNITAYEIGKSTKISVVTIQRIINGETKNPNDLTIDAISDFLESAVVGTNIKNKDSKIYLIEEPKENYNLESLSRKFSDCLEEKIKLINHINYLEKLLTINNIDFEEFKE